MFGKRRKAIITGFILLISFLMMGNALADEVTTQEVLFTVNNIWMLVATALVFLMHLGFATVESGLTRAKNTVNILFKNFIIVAIGLLTYALLGFNLMYPGEAWILSMLQRSCIAMRRATIPMWY